MCRDQKHEDKMDLSAKKEKWLNSGLQGRLHRWIKDEHAVGLDVYNGQIVATHFAEHSGELHLAALATEQVDPALSDKELARCIRAFWKKNKLPTRTVCTSLHTPSLIVRSFAYTNVLSDELHRVLTLEAEEALQLPIEQISLSWHLNPLSSENKNEISGALVAAPRNKVLRHIKLLQAAGLYPVNVEIDCSAVINLYDFMARDEYPAPVCLVDLTASMAGIVILANGSAWPRIVFSGSEEGWRNNLGYLVENIESALLHYQLKTTGKPVGKLRLTGDRLQDETLEKINQALSIPAERWSLSPEKIRSLTRLEKFDLPGEVETFNLATSLGLGLHHPKKEL